jgi:DNA-binding LacI/PurR family transcriptional regulator
MFIAWLVNAEYTAVMDLSDRRPLGKALRQLRACIADGEFAPGERLGSEAALAKRAGVSRFTIHAALEQLASEGLIRPLARRGWLRPAVAPVPGACLDRMVGIVGRHFDLGELDVRRALADSVAVYAGILGAIGRSGLHAAILQPDRALGGDIDALAGGGLRGLLIMYEMVEGGASRALVGHLARLRLPVVIHADGEELPGVDSVVSDHAAGCRDLVRWLVRRGRRRILRLREQHDASVPWPGWLADRDRGYAEGCRESGIAELPWLTVQVPNATLGADDAASFDMKARIIQSHLHAQFATPERPDAILVPSDRNAFAVAVALRRLGFDPRRDVPVCGYDATARACRETAWDPFVPAASVDRDSHGIGTAMVATLAKRIGAGAGEPIVHRHQPRLVPDLP